MKNLKRIIETAKQLPLQERGPYLRNSTPNADRGLSMFLAGTALENRDLVWAWRICRQSRFKDLAQDGGSVAVAMYAAEIIRKSRVKVFSGQRLSLYRLLRNSERWPEMLGGAVGPPVTNSPIQAANVSYDPDVNWDNVQKIADKYRAENPPLCTSCGEPYKLEDGTKLVRASIQVCDWCYNF